MGGALIRGKSDRLRRHPEGVRSEVGSRTRRRNKALGSRAEQRPSRTRSAAPNGASSFAEVRIDKPALTPRSAVSMDDPAPCRTCSTAASPSSPGQPTGERDDAGRGPGRGAGGGRTTPRSESPRSSQEATDLVGGPHRLRRRRHRRDLPMANFGAHTGPARGRATPRARSSS